MTAITIKAHFDGTSIQLDEPAALPVDTPLLVTVSSANGENKSREEWATLSRHALERAYGENEPEYSPSDTLE